MDENDPLHRTGAIYSFAASSATSSKAPDEWRTMLITLAGEEILVDLDGRRITSFDSRSRDVPKAQEWFEPKRPEAGSWPDGLTGYGPRRASYRESAAMACISR